MDTPWFIAAMTLLVYLFSYIMARIAMWVRMWRSATIVSAWGYDPGDRVGRLHLKFPSPGYQIVRCGNSFRGERTGRAGRVERSFRRRTHVGDALRDCWDDWETFSSASQEFEAGTAPHGSALPDVSGSLHTA